MGIQAVYSGAKDTGALLEPLRANLATWVPTQKGAFFFSRDPLETLSLLAESPGGFRLVMQYESDAPTGGEQPGYFNPVLRTVISMVVSFNPGLAPVKDGKILKGDATRASLMNIVSTVRKRMLAYRWDTALVDNGQLSYESTNPYEMQDFLPFAAYQMRFSMVHNTPTPASGDLVTLTVV